MMVQLNWGFGAMEELMPELYDPLNIFGFDEDEYKEAR